MGRIHLLNAVIHSHTRVHVHASRARVNDELLNYVVRCEMISGMRTFMKCDRKHGNGLADVVNINDGGVKTDGRGTIPTN